MDTVQLQWVLPASLTAAMIAILIAIIEKLLPKMLFIIKPEEGASYHVGDTIPLQVDAFNNLARLRLYLVNPWVKWFDDKSPTPNKPIASRINPLIKYIASKPGTHTMTVKAPGFISGQVAIEVK